MGKLEINDKVRLKRIAVNQQQLLLCIGLLLVFALMSAYDRSAGENSIFNHELYDIPAILYGITNFAAVIFVILLAANAYNSVIGGILFGLLCLIPCIGILVLLGINQQATRLLRANNIKVGFWGAKMDQFK